MAVATCFNIKIIGGSFNILLQSRWSFSLVPTPWPGYEAKLNYYYFHENCTSLLVSDANLLAIVLQLFPEPNSPWSITAGVKPPPPDLNKLCANRTAISTTGMMQVYSIVLVQLSKSADVCNRLVNTVKHRPLINHSIVGGANFCTEHAHTKYYSSLYCVDHYHQSIIKF